MNQRTKPWQKLRISKISKLLTLTLAFFIASLIASPPVWADTSLLVRTFSGITYTTSDGIGGDGAGHHVGARFMLSANKRQSYGLEIIQLDLYSLESNSPDIRYTAVGLMIEQIKGKSFLMSIGTIGYFGTGDNDDNPFGFRTSLGWEPQLENDVSPFIAYRNDFIFDKPSRQVIALSAGVRIRF